MVEVFDTVVDISHTTRVLIDRRDVTVITEKMPFDKTSPKIVSFATNGYEKDRVIYTLRKDFAADIDIKDAFQLQRIIDKLHREAIEEIKAGKDTRKEPVAYLQAIKAELDHKNTSRALQVAKEAYDLHPDDPIVLSYYGYLKAMVNSDFASALGICERAISLHPRKLPAGLGSSQKPLLYFHLTRVLLASGNRDEAVHAIYRGIGFDVEGGILHRELERLGIRRRPVIPFFGRDNALNRLLGRLRHRVAGPSDTDVLEDARQVPEAESGQSPPLA